jgi:hypothetical protein
LIDWFRFYCIKKAPFAARKFLSPPLKNQWTALRAALAAPASRRGISFLERFYHEARTYFES